LPVEPEKIYVTGNHDRLCNQFSSIREKVRRFLGIAPGDAPLAHFFQDTDHRVFARQGHEYDKFNYEGGLGYRFSDYMKVSIGDPITTELVAGLPWKVLQHPLVKKYRGNTATIYGKTLRKSKRYGLLRSRLKRTGSPKTNWKRQPRRSICTPTAELAT
jgi:hypothetical protein